MTQPDYIPKEFWAALEQQPDCFTLRSAIADRLEELELYDYAECIRWSIAKKVVPDNAYWFKGGVFSPYIDLLPSFLMKHQNTHAYHYQKCSDYYNAKGVVRAFIRLLNRWEVLSSSQKAEVWNWEPSTGVSK